MPRPDRAKSYGLERFQGLRSPFEEPIVVLYSELSTLRDLNKRLTKSVIEMQDQDLTDWLKKAARLKGRDRAELEKIQDGVLDFWASDFRSKTKVNRRTFGTSSTKAANLFMKLVTTVVHPHQFNDLIRNMSLVYLISVFENFMERVLEIAFWKQPLALIPTQKTVSAVELIESKDLQSAKGKLIVKAIDSIMHGDIEEMDHQFLQKWKIRLSGFKHWKEFRERFYRRNLIVHTAGRVDSAYKSKTGYKGKAKVLTVSERYLLKSIVIFEDMGLSLVEAFHHKFIGSRSRQSKMWR